MTGGAMSRSVALTLAVTAMSVTQDEPNPLRDAVHELIQRWRALVAFPLVSAVLAVGVSFLVPRRYEGTVIFSPAEDVSSNLPGNLLSIASQFGITPGVQGYSVYYFAEVTKSREVSRRVAGDTLEADGARTPVLELLGVGSGTDEQRIDQAIRALRSWVTVRTNDQAELVTIHARGPSPGLASALAASVLDALNAVTTASIQLGGSAERRFAQAQADSARIALRQAENQLRDFYQANRNFEGSPALKFEEARLRREIQILQDLYLAMVNQAEAAKLREVKNTPAVAIVQPPQASARKVWPRRSVWALFAMIGAFVTAGAWTYVVRPLLASAKQDKDTPTS
jgi:uncharacterized protein involved in exopolysaccharide biosynthesis